MTGPRARSVWADDLAGLCERLAEQLRNEGASHPRSGAVALVARGLQGQTRAAFAVQLGRSEAELAAIETGRVGRAAWPDALRRHAGAVEGDGAARRASASPHLEPGPPRRD